MRTSQLFPAVHLKVPNQIDVPFKFYNFESKSNISKINVFLYKKNSFNNY